MAATGTVTFTSNGSAGNYELQTSYTWFPLIRTNNFPSFSYEISSVDISFTLRNYRGDGAVYFGANKDNSSNLGSVGYGSFSGSLATSGKLTKSYNYAGLTQLGVKRGASQIQIVDGTPRIVITVSWKESYTKCTAPTTLTVSPSLTGGDNATLTWSGAAAGTVNDITGYGIQYQDSADGTTWGAWTDLTTIASTSTSGSTTVAINPTPGQYRRYRMQTQGAAGSAYYSDWSTASTAVQRYGKAQAPNSVIASTNTPGVSEQLTLSWTGASAGTGDTIEGYGIYRAETADGEYELIDTVPLTTTSGSATVDAPDTFGGSYYFKVATISATGTLYDSALSTAYAQVTAGYGLCTAPTSVTASPTTSYPLGMVGIRWTGAAGGYLNPITGYEVARATTPNGAYSAIGNATGEYFATPAPDTIGTTYYYKIRTVGTINGYDSEFSTAYASVTTDIPIAVTGGVGKTNTVIA